MKRFTCEAVLFDLDEVLLNSNACKVLNYEQ